MNISVALCTYNGATHLPVQLKSILAQTVPVHEIIICDDGSTDDTVAIIENFQKQYPGLIHLHVNKENLGAKKNFEQAVQFCTGDIIFLSDQDDIWLEHKVAATLHFFENNPNATAVFSDGSLINVEGELLPDTMWDSIGFSEKLRNHVIPTQLFEFLIIVENVVTGAAMCFKKEVIDYIIPFFCPDRYWHDYWIALAAAYKNQLYFTEEKLIHYRLHDNQQASLPKMNDFYKKRHLIKEMLWLQQYNGAHTGWLYNMFVASKKRSELFAPPINRLLPQCNRTEKLNTHISSQMEILKKKLFAEMGFFKRKKLFVIWLLGRQKTFNITRSDVFKLLLS